MEHLFIVNPIAGGKDATPDIRKKVEAVFERHGGNFEVYVTKGPMDAPQKIRDAARSGEALRVYACGGDGTFNECVNGAAHLPNVAVCPFPTGTGNDFCRMFGEEKDLYRDLDALLDGDTQAIDLINCNGRYCSNICSVGIDARIGTDVHKYSHLPIVGGSAGYVVSTVVNVLKGINRHMTIKCGDFFSDAKHAMVCICNGRYYGGGFNPSLSAMPNDGILDMFVVKNVSLLQLSALIGKYAKGQADEMKNFITHLRGDYIEVGFDEANVINVDGEAIFAEIVKISLEPLALNLITPKGMKFFASQNLS